MSDGNEVRMKDKLFMLKQQRKNFCEKKWQLGFEFSHFKYKESFPPHC